MTLPFLSIIIPAYNEEQRLPHTLAQVLNYLSQQNYPAEVLVIENGSTDRTLEIAQNIAQSHPNIRAIHESTRGKGQAIRRGVQESRGQYLFLCDADLSMPIEELSKFLPPVLNDFDIAIASREAPGAVRHNEPYYRHLTGRIFNAFIRLLVLPGLQDTQCGFKCFRSEVAREVFRYQTLSGWAFDVEILAIAHQRGYRIIEIPIHWYYIPGSKISILRDSWRMFLDLLIIRKNMRSGRYDSPRPDL
ncbi:MAG: dolichyl-phosphate beta-glucosyltransferase [Anaerolineae bacterium]